jgi:hypothetical protein
MYRNLEKGYADLVRFQMDRAFETKPRDIAKALPKTISVCL